MKKGEIIDKGTCDSLIKNMVKKTPEKLLKIVEMCKFHKYKFVSTSSLPNKSSFQKFWLIY